MSVSVVNISCTFENLYDSLSSGNLENLTFSGLSVSKLDVDDLRISGELDIVKDDEGSLDIEDRAVVYTGCNVVVALSGASVYYVVSHFTRIVCCFSCKLLKSALKCKLRWRF